MTSIASRVFAPAFSFMVLALAACGSSDASAPGADASIDAADSAVDGGASGDAGSDSATDALSPDAAAILAARPYTIKVPAAYDPSKPTPLVVMFHGYSATGSLEESYLRIGAGVDTHGYIYAYGEGTVDPSGNQFWNATDGCCNKYGSSVDDVAYAAAILDDIALKYNVDAKRVFIVGHSNGGFMSHRLACDLSPRIAAIVSLAGAVWNDPAMCKPTSRVSILDLHGDADATILYGGGGTPPYPSEATTMATWASKNGCSGALTASGVTLDLDTSLAGPETVEKKTSGCPAGVDVTLWTIQGGSHIPSVAHPGWVDAMWTFLSAHPKT